MRPFTLAAALLLAASTVQADGVPTPPTPLHQPPRAPERMMPPPRALSPWETLVEPREPLPVLAYAPVPEPASAALLGAALVVLGWRRR